MNLDWYCISFTKLMLTFIVTTFKRITVFDIMFNLPVRNLACLGSSGSFTSLIGVIFSLCRAVLQTQMCKYRYQPWRGVFPSVLWPVTVCVCVHPVPRALLSRTSWQGKCSASRVGHPLSQSSLVCGLGQVSLGWPLLGAAWGILEDPGRALIGSLVLLHSGIENEEGLHPFKHFGFVSFHNGSLLGALSGRDTLSPRLPSLSSPPAAGRWAPKERASWAWARKSLLKVSCVFVVWENDVGIWVGMFRVFLPLPASFDLTFCHPYQEGNGCWSWQVLASGAPDPSDVNCGISSCCPFSLKLYTVLA